MKQRKRTGYMDVGRLSLLATYLAPPSASTNTRPFIDEHGRAQLGLWEAKTFRSLDEMGTVGAVGRLMPGLVIQSRQLTKQTQPLTPPFSPCNAHADCTDFVVTVSLVITEPAIRGTCLKTAFIFWLSPRGTFVIVFDPYLIFVVTMLGNLFQRGCAVGTWRRGWFKQWTWNGEVVCGQATGRCIDQCPTKRESLRFLFHFDTFSHSTRWLAVFGDSCRLAPVPCFQFAIQLGFGRGPLTLDFTACRGTM